MPVNMAGATLKGDIDTANINVPSGSYTAFPSGDEIRALFSSLPFFVIIKNTGGVSRNCQIRYQANRNGRYDDVLSSAQSIQAGAERWFGPFWDPEGWSPEGASPPYVAFEGHTDLAAAQGFIPRKPARP